MTWLDFVIAIILIISVATGWMTGLARVAIGFVSLILAFILAAWFYGSVGGFLLPLVQHKVMANVMGFAIVFMLVMLAGGLLSRLVRMVFRLTGLSILDRLGGASFGFVRGILACVVLVTALLSFAPGKMSDTISQSQSAPYILEAARTISAATPIELKQAFQIGYNEATAALKEAVRRHPKKKRPVEEE